MKVELFRPGEDSSAESHLNHDLATGDGQASSRIRCCTAHQPGCTITPIKSVEAVVAVLTAATRDPALAKGAT